MTSLSRLSPNGLRPTATVAFLLIVGSIALHSCGDNEPAKNDREALADACRFLRDAQAKDGGWHSRTHGILRGGQAWTPFVLHALLGVPEETRGGTDADVERGLEFIRRHTNDSGALGLANPVILEYPNYATSYALRLLVAHGSPADSGIIARMTGYLERQQFDSNRGFTPDSLVFGSWGFGETNLSSGEYGHVDLSHTRRVLQALREAGRSDSNVYDHARHFLGLLQKDPSDGRIQPTVNSDAKPCTEQDGGFYSSPVVWIANKGGELDSCSSFRSYATATCDGLLSLLATGYSPDDPPVRKAIDWLARNSALDAPEGIPTDNPNQWHRVMFFYHLAVRAEVYSRVGWKEEDRATVLRLIRERQRPDGSFRNPAGALNKEDDPLLATALAVIAMNHALNDK